MRLSNYFLPTLKETPKDAEIVSHRLMLRAGMIRQSSAGIYNWLPLGYRVLAHIADIVRDEQNRAGAIEMLMPTIQPADIWRESGRYDEYGKEMLRIADRHKRDLLYGPTNEEQMTQIIRDNIHSYKDLPRNLYHIQWKFRDEIRPRFGVMRGREFLMKDAYSFDLTEAGARIAFQKMFIAYLRTFARLGLKALPMAAAAGPIGGDMSYEFIILAQTGESEIFCHSDLVELKAPDENINYADDLTPIIARYQSYYAASDEQHDAARFATEVPQDKQMQARGIEVGHIFYFGDKYTSAMNCLLETQDGKQVALHCGSYGIGVSRLVGAIIEASHDEAGIIWPWAVAPFRVGIVNVKVGDRAADALAEKLYTQLNAAGITVLYDDRNERAGAKFSDMDLIGLPWQAIIGPRGAQNNEIELKNRATGARENLSFDAAMARLCLPPDSPK